MAEEASDDPIKEFEEAGKERLRDPFYFSLIISFAAVNWEAIYFLLWPSGGLDAEGRMNWIAGNLYSWWWPWLYKLFLIPLGFACLYVGVFPNWINKLKARRYRAQRELETRQAAIDEDVITKVRLKVDLLRDELEREKKTTADLNIVVGERNNALEQAQAQAIKDVAQAKVEAGGHFLNYMINDQSMKQSIKQLRRNNTTSNRATNQFLVDSGFLEHKEGKWVFTSAGEEFASKFPQ